MDSIGKDTSEVKGIVLEVMFAPENVGAPDMEITGVAPPDEARLPVAVTDVTGGVTRAASGMVLTVKLAPDIAGVLERAILGVGPPDDVRLGPVAVTEVTPPPHAPHAGSPVETNRHCPFDPMPSREYVTPSAL